MYRKKIRLHTNNGGFNLTNSMLGLKKMQKNIQTKFPSKSNLICFGLGFLPFDLILGKIWICF